MYFNVMFCQNDRTLDFSDYFCAKISAFCWRYE